jgi:HEAT repeat protein
MDESRRRTRSRTSWFLLLFGILTFGVLLAGQLALRGVRQHLRASRAARSVPTRGTNPAQFPGTAGAERNSTTDDRCEVARALAIQLTGSAGWQVVDLSDWLAIDQFTRIYMVPALQRLGAKPADSGLFVSLLKEARSTRMRQMLLLALGELGAPDAQCLAAYLCEPGLTAASAYALGRLGTPEAAEILRKQLGSNGLSRSDREALYYGLAQTGADSVPILVKAMEAQLLLGAQSNDAFPLAYVHSPAGRDALKAVALEHPNPAVRAAAIQGFISASNAKDGGLDWLVHVSADQTEDTVVRAQAMEGLASLESAQWPEVFGALFEQTGSAGGLLVSALDAAAIHGIPEGQLDRVATVASGASDGEVRTAALRALAAAGIPAADLRLVDLLPTLSDPERSVVLSELAARNPPYWLSHEPGVGKPLSPALIAAVSALPGGPAEQFALQVLAGSQTHRLAAEEAAWTRLASDEDEHARRETLKTVVSLVGQGANEELMRAFARADEFIPRIEVATSLAAIPGNMEQEQTATFLKSQVLPYLRSRIVTDTGAWLAYFGPGRTQVNPLAITISNVFGRFGDLADVELLDSLGARFLENQRDWPEPLQSSMRRSVEEAAARAADLITFRLAPDRPR